MKNAMPWFVAVALGYVLLIGGVLYLVPMPWSLLVASIVLLMGLRFVFTIRRVSQLGVKSGRK